MSKARQAVLDKINKRAAKIQAKNRSRIKKRGLWSMTADFIKAMEIVKEESATHFEFQMGLETEANKLYFDIKTLDPEVNVTIKWNKENVVDDWQDLMVQGVQVEWSRWHRGKHPLEAPSKYIDIGQLFLEGYFDE
jgi:hypothetical protein